MPLACFPANRTALRVVSERNTWASASVLNNADALRRTRLCEPANLLQSPVNAPNGSAYSCSNTVASAGDDDCHPQKAGFLCVNRVKMLPRGKDPEKSRADKAGAKCKLLDLQRLWPLLASLRVASIPMANVRWQAPQEARFFQRRLAGALPLVRSSVRRLERCAMMPACVTNTTISGAAPRLRFNAAPVPVSPAQGLFRAA